MVVYDDQLWAFIGNFSYFTVVIIILKGAFNLLVAAADMSANFMSPYLDYWCNVSSLNHLPQSLQQYLISPDGSGCHTYDITWNYTDETYTSWNWSDVELDDYRQVGCHGWIYDNSTFTSPTATTEWELVCDKEGILHAISPVYMTGLAIGSLLTGPISDKFGRLRGTMLFLLLHILSGTLVVFSPNVWIYMFARSVYGLALRGANQVAAILAVELIVPSYRSTLMVFCRVIFCVGVMLVAGLAYAVRYFRYLQFLLLLPAIAMLSYYWIFPESPRWLSSKGRMEEAEKAVSKLFQRYQRQIPAEIIHQYAQGKSPDRDTQSQKSDKFRGRMSTKEYISNVKDLFLHPVIRKYTLVVGYNKLSTQFIYFAVSLNMGMLVGDVYLNTFLAGAIEIPSLFLVLWSMPRLGRKLTVAISFIVATVSGAASVVFLLVSDLRLGATVSMLICRSAAGCAMCSSSTFSAELYPTSCRQTAAGLTSGLAAIVSIIAPLVGGPLTSVWRPLPNVIFTVLVSISVILVFFLPETLYQRLPDTTEDAANLINNAVKRRGLTKVSVGSHETIHEVQTDERTNEMGHRGAADAESMGHVTKSTTQDISWRNEDGVKLEMARVGQVGFANPLYTTDRDDDKGITKY